MRMIEKHVERLLFCLGISKPLSLGTGLILPHMLGLDIVSYPYIIYFLFFFFFFFSPLKKKKKKIGGEDAVFYFILLDFSDIACIFA
jgi:hypothetical protein